MSSDSGHTAADAPIPLRTPDSEPGEEANEEMTYFLTKPSAIPQQTTKDLL
jgi:hypothetical protein